MKRGLVLEGGGAKGAYHVGAVKALYDNGYSFDGIAGTSIGAINGAIIAQEDNYETCMDMWTNVKPSDIITDIDNAEVERLFNKNFDKISVKYWISMAVAIIKNLGLPTDKVVPFLRRYINEDKIRFSGRDFAIVTVCITDKKPLELHLEDIPYGELCDYIFASAYFPLFKMGKINGKFYIDGGLYDNLPINALIRKNTYDEIIAIRTGSKMPRKPAIDPTVVIKTIEPSESLGNTTELDAKRVAYNIKLGYYDAIKMINNYKGTKYYFNDMEYTKIGDYLYNLSDETIRKISALYKLKADTRKFEVINAVYYYAKKGNITLSDNQSFLAYLERYAQFFGLDKFVIYSFDEFICQLKEKFQSHNIDAEEKPKTAKISKLNKLFEIIISD